mgnify:CR=1 FL=1
METNHISVIVVEVWGNEIPQVASRQEPGKGYCVHCETCSDCPEFETVLKIKMTLIFDIVT